MTSYWLRELRKSTEASALPSYVDVLVIGGGYSGVSTAYWLSKSKTKKSVALLEQRDHLSGGATGRNGGHLWPRTDTSLEEAVSELGEKQAIKLWKFTLENVDSVKKFISGNKVNCEFRENGSVEFASTPEELKGLEAQYKYLMEKGLANDMEWWDKERCRKETTNDLFSGGLLYKKAGQLWPAKLVWGIAEEATKLGAKIYTNTEVLASEYSSKDKIHTVTTNKGKIQAKVIVYATNAYTGRLLPQVSSIITPVRGQVVCSSPLPKIFPYGGITNSGYEYWVQQPDGRVVLGGMRWKSPSKEIGITDDTKIVNEVGQGLEQFLKKLFPTQPDLKVDYHWTGIMGFSSDDNPLVGPLPNAEGVYLIAGFTGHGMPLIFGSGHAIASMIDGEVPASFPECLLPSRFSSLKASSNSSLKAKL